MSKNKIYEKNPAALQSLLLTGRGFLYNFLRQGGVFRKMLSELESMEHFDAGKIREWQNKKLSLLVRHSYKNVPYYNRIFKKLGIIPADIKGMEDLKKLPFLTKEDVRRNPEDFLARNINRFFVTKNFTSGTSGKPLKLYRSLYSISFENAIVWRQRKWGGLDFSDRIVVLREEQIVPFGVKKPPFWRYSMPEKRLFLSAYHLSEENVSYYVKAIKDFKPKAIEAEPSLLYILARFIKKQGISSGTFSIKSIFTSSEMLLDTHKQIIEEVFGARIYDFYGNAERVAAIGTCEKGNYHVLPEYGITEFLPLSAEPGKVEIVGTALHNYAMPLLRYRTGDMVELLDSDCACNRKFRTIGKIKGRISDFLICKDGRIAVDACYLTLKGVDNILQSQIIQEDLDTISIKFIPGENFSKKDKDKIMNNVKAYMGPEVEVFLEQDSEIANDKTTKYRPFISKVKL